MNINFLAIIRKKILAIINMEYEVNYNQIEPFKKKKLFHKDIALYYLLFFSIFKERNKHYNCFLGWLSLGYVW